MAVYTVTTTAVQEAAITAARLTANETQDPDFPDNAAFVAAHVATQLLAPAVATFIEARLHIVADAYRAATAEQRQQVDTVLGL